MTRLCSTCDPVRSLVTLDDCAVVPAVAVHGPLSFRLCLEVTGARTRVRPPLSVRERTRASGNGVAARVGKHGPGLEPVCVVNDPFALEQRALA